MYGIEVFIEKGPGTPQNRFQTIDDLHPEYPWAALEVDTLSGMCMNYEGCWIRLTGSIQAI
jgi:hypothetical protein